MRFAYPGAAEPFTSAPIMSPSAQNGMDPAINARLMETICPAPSGSVPAQSAAASIGR